MAAARDQTEQDFAEEKLPASGHPNFSLEVTTKRAFTAIEFGFVFGKETQVFADNFHLKSGEGLSARFSLKASGPRNRTIFCLPSQLFF
jgi:hypothetical protein